MRHLIDCNPIMTHRSPISLLGQAQHVSAWWDVLSVSVWWLVIGTDTLIDIHVVCIHRGISTWLGAGVRRGRCCPDDTMSHDLAGIVITQFILSHHPSRLLYTLNWHQFRAYVHEYVFLCSRRISMRSLFDVHYCSSSDVKATGHMLSKQGKY